MLPKNAKVKYLRIGKILQYPEVLGISTILSSMGQGDKIFKDWKNTIVINEELVK